MRDVYVVESLRTPLGSFGGALADLEAPVSEGTVVGPKLVTPLGNAVRFVHGQRGEAQLAQDAPEIREGQPLG